MNALVRGVAALAFTALAHSQGACSKTATIRLKDGSEIEAEIRRSDADRIYVFPERTWAEASDTTSSLGKPPEGIVVQELVEDCVDDWSDACEKECLIKVTRGTYKGRLESCLETCPDEDTIKTRCVAMSVEIPIERSEISDIDHPSDGLLGVSVGFTVVGAIATGIGVSFASGGGLIGHALGMWIGIPGLAMFIPSTIGVICNAIVYHGSVSASKPPDGPQLTPVAIGDGEKTYWGIGLTWSW